MVTVTTKSGFTCKIDKEKMKDWRYVKALAQMESGDTNEVFKGLAFAIPFLLGKAEDKLIEHCTKKDVCNMADIVSEYREIVALLGAMEKK